MLENMHVATFLNIVMRDEQLDLFGKIGDQVRKELIHGRLKLTLTNIYRGKSISSRDCSLLTLSRLTWYE